MSDKLEEPINAAAEELPLSVRVDYYYKKMFHDIAKEKHFPKKLLMESMISHYAQQDRKDQREEHIRFTHEIDLLSGCMTEILNIFKTMAEKSQDTVASVKDSLGQKLQAITAEKISIEANLAELFSRNLLLEKTNQEFEKEREQYIKEITELRKEGDVKDKAITSLRTQNSDLLIQINDMRQVATENIQVREEIGKARREIDDVRQQLEERDREIQVHKTHIDQLNTAIGNLRGVTTAEKEELEETIRKKVELEMKEEFLKLQTQYNNLQAENIANLNTIRELREANIKPSSARRQKKDSSKK